MNCGGREGCGCGPVCSVMATFLGACLAFTELPVQRRSSSVSLLGSFGQSLLATEPEYNGVFFSVGNCIRRPLP